MVARIAPGKQRLKNGNESDNPLHKHNEGCTPPGAIIVGQRLKLSHVDEKIAHPTLQ